MCKHNILYHDLSDEEVPKQDEQKKVKSERKIKEKCCGKAEWIEFTSKHKKNMSDPWFQERSHWHFCMLAAVEKERRGLSDDKRLN